MHMPLDIYRRDAEAAVTRRTNGPTMCGQSERRREETASWRINACRTIEGKDQQEKPETLKQAQQASHP
jgi:hypothetical protein